MGFVIGAVKSVKRKVKFKVPSDAGKAPVEADFVATLAVRDTETVKARIAELQRFSAAYAKAVRNQQQDPEALDAINISELDERFLREDLEDLGGIKDVEGNELPFSEDLVTMVLNDTSARAALLAVWRDHNTLDGAQRKN